MADIPAAWANNPTGYQIYLAESSKASQLAQQSNTQVQQAQQQFQAVQSGQRQLSSSTLQQIQSQPQSQPASAPSTRYQQIQQQYQQQHLASVGTSGTMYPDEKGQMVYVSGPSTGQVFTPTVQQPLTVKQQLPAKQQQLEQARQQVFANYLGHIEAGRAAGNIAPVERPPQGIVGKVLTAASQVTSLGQTGYQAIVARGVAGAAKVLNQPQERLVPVAEPFKVSIQKSGVKLPYFGEVGIPAVEGNPFYGMSKQRRALPGVETLAVFLEPKEKASTAKFREEYNRQQAQQQQAAREQAVIVGEAQKKGWFNAAANQIETPDTSEGRAFAERVNKAGLQTMKANAASAGLFAAGEKYNIVKKVQTPQGETYQFNPENRTTDYEYLMGRANVAGAAGIKAGVPGLSENLALARRVAEAQATLAPTNPAMLAGAFGAGAAEEVVRKPATAAQNVALGAIFGGVTKGIGLAGEAAGITKGAAGVRGVAARWVPRVAGGAMVGMYGADIGMRVSAEPTIGAKMGRIGAIGSTEVAPMAIGFGGGYKAVEKAAPKVRAGYDLIKGSVNRVHEANVLGTARIRTIEASNAADVRVLGALPEAREVTIVHGGATRQYIRPEPVVRRPTIEIKSREAGGLNRIGETIYLGRKLKPGEIPQNALVPITPIGEQLRAGGTGGMGRPRTITPVYEFMPEEPKARLFYDRPAERVSSISKIRTLSDVVSSADAAKRTTPILNVQAGTFEYRGVTPSTGKTYELANVYQRLPKVEAPKTTAYKSNMGNPRWDTRAKAQSDILSYKAQTDWVIGEPVKQVREVRESPLGRGGGTVPKQTRPLTGAEAIEVARGERQALQQIKMKPFEFKSQAKAEVDSLVKEARAQEQYARQQIKQQPQRAVAIQVEQAVLPSYQLEKSVGRAEKPALKSAMGRQDFGFGRRQRMRLVEEPTSDYGPLALQYQFANAPKAPETRLKTPASSLMAAGVLIGSTQGMQQAQKAETIQRIRSGSSEMMKQASKTTQAQYDILGTSVASKVAQRQKQEPILARIQERGVRQETAQRLNQDVIPRQDIIPRQEIVPIQTPIIIPTIVPVPTQKPPLLATQLWTNAGPQPKPQFGAWNPEGGMGSYPRQHGLYAFEERLALITPGQMMTGMWGSKRKSARRKKIR